MARPAPPLLLLAALAGCATPVAPSGGPADTTPPALVEAVPDDGATNVDGRTLTLTFSERLDPASAQAVQVTPEGDLPPEVRVRAREVAVTLPPLRDSTTYVVTVGTELRDQRGVALPSPITVAFSTGPTIDRGRLDGVVRAPATGAGVGGLAVWAYALADTTALPDVRTVAPDYRTQTGTDGAFRFGYLRPGPYFVAAVADRNRNGRADAGERFAAPPRPALRASADSAAPPPARFWMAALDTIPPEARRVQTLSDRRFGVRFSEAVRLGDAGAGGLTVADSASGRPIEATAYQPPGDAFVVFVQTASALPPTRHVVVYAGGDAIADSSGLPPLPFSLGFTPPERPDTTQARFVGFVLEADSVAVLGRGQRPGIRFTVPPADVAARVDAEGIDSLRLETDDGVTFRLPPDALPASFALAVRDGDTTYVQRYAVLSEDETGAIVGTVAADAGAVLVEVRPEAGDEPVTTVSDGDGRFSVGGLAPGAYRVRLVGDRDGNGRWDGGRLVPYLPPEPVVILDGTVTVRARWETEIDPVDLRAP